MIFTKYHSISMIFSKYNWYLENINDIFYISIIFTKYHRYRMIFSKFYIYQVNHELKYLENIIPYKWYFLNIVDILKISMILRNIMDMEWFFIYNSYIGDIIDIF